MFAKSIIGNVLIAERRFRLVKKFVAYILVGLLIPITSYASDMERQVTRALLQTEGAKEIKNNLEKEVVKKTKGLVGEDIGLAIMVIGEITRTRRLRFSKSISKHSGVDIELSNERAFVEAKIEF